jgi:hypothetical protein
VGKFTPQMAAFVRHQLERHREPWKIADQLARQAKVERAAAEAFVKEVTEEIRPKVAQKQRTHLIVGIILMALGTGITLWGLTRHVLIGWSLMLIGGGFIEAYWGWVRWRRASRPNSK